MERISRICTPIQQMDGIEVEVIYVSSAVVTEYHPVMGGGSVPVEMPRTTERRQIHRFDTEQAYRAFVQIAMGTSGKPTEGRE